MATVKENKQEKGAGTFSIVGYGNQLIIDYIPTKGDEITLNRLIFKSPSVEVKGNQFKFFECGIYKKGLNLNQISTIGEEEPIDADVAFRMIMDLIKVYN
jgi:hypothetical protein